MDLKPLVESLRQANLVAFVGAGISRSYKDPETNRTYPGLPSAKELVEAMASRRSYIDRGSPFPEACFLFKEEEARSALEKLLLELLDKPTLKPLPAHVILSNLPFVAFVTTNYDDLLERALREAKHEPHSVIVDQDVARLCSHHVPILKIHGCISRPETMIAAEDEYRPLADSHPIIEALLRTQLANRMVLFLGYSLEDYDFRTAYEQVKAALGDHMPRSYAVVHTASSYRKRFWKSRGVQVMESDATEFLRALLRATAEIDAPTVYYPGGDWMNNAFFESLHNIRTLPSETQVVTAYLGHLLEELRAPGFSLGDVIARARTAASLVLARRLNLHALRRVSDGILQTISAECTSKEQAELVVRRTMEERDVVARGIARKAPEIIQRGDSILIFSQSVRVVQFLSAVARGVQDTCHVYVAECRPKSPDPFQDALAFCRALRDTGYEFTIVPDVAVGNLLARRQLHKVLLGAHTVFRVGDRPVAFVNTAGTRTILLAARDAETPVFVIAESMKITDVSDTSDIEQQVSFDQEEDLSQCIGATLSDLKAEGQRIGTLNIGYDLCPIMEHCRIVTEH